MLMSLLTIQDVAEPQAIRSMSFLAEAQLFQKCSKPDMKLERGVSIHGSSSKKRIFFPSGNEPSHSSNAKKASYQFLN